jgi:uncharacterized membrane protein YciS (DUF1049 family)
MTVADLAQLLAGLGLLINALFTGLAYMQSRSNGKQITEVHKATNSLTDRLVDSTAKESFAAGVKQGQEAPRK